MTKSTKPAPSDRIRGFVSLNDYEDGVAEGRVVIREIEGYRLRRIWHEGEWWHSVIDVVGALTESVDAKDYWAQTRKRLQTESGSRETLTDCQRLKLVAADGKMRATDCATTETLFRIIQSIPSKRAEPIKRFLAEAGAERLEEAVQPSKAVDRAIRTYRRMGRDDEWIDDRLQNRSARNEMTDEWQDRGVPERKFGPLTSRMSKEMLGVTTRAHKSMKQLGKPDSLRDHMDSIELAVSTLGERAAKAIMVADDTRAEADSAEASMAGATIAGDAARKIEQRIGRPVANGGNFLEAPTSKRRIGESES